MSLIAIKAFLTRFWPFLAFAALAGLLLLTYCEGKGAGKEEAKTDRLEGNVKSLEEKGKADEKAAEVRLEHAARAIKERTELEEVTKDAPDPASARRAYYRCIGLQQAAREAGRPAPACS